jgi:hypothetical protein
MSARPNAGRRNPEQQDNAENALWDGIVRSYSEACSSIVKRDGEGNLLHINDTQRFAANLSLADRGMEALVRLNPREAMKLMTVLRDEISPGLLQTILEIA